MASRGRPAKKGAQINIKMEEKLLEKVENYAYSLGIDRTKAIEKILAAFFEVADTDIEILDAYQKSMPEHPEQWVVRMKHDLMSPDYLRKRRPTPKDDASPMETSLSEEDLLKMAESVYW